MLEKVEKAASGHGLGWEQRGHGSVEEEDLQGDVSTPYLLPFLAVYLFPLWFVLGWNWPWCSRDNSWEICCKAGKAR